jgi:hypothetical protein
LNRSYQFPALFINAADSSSRLISRPKRAAGKAIPIHLAHE